MNSAADQAEFIDVKQRIRELSVEELCGSAEDFFAQRANWDSLLAKPLSDIEEAPELLVCFAHVVRGLKLLPDMTVLDFGAGSCWTARFLTQLGMKVIALDVSPSALRMGRKLYRRHPVFGPKPRPEFLLFDGRTINLPDESVDRITCWEAFHHVPNPEQVIKEMARVLKPGGIAGFSEPGPNHSKSEQSQNEMRTNRVIENDIDIHQIWRDAQLAGFTDLQLAAFSPEPITLSLAEFDNLLSGENTDADYMTQLRQQMQQRRLFFMFKGEPVLPLDSRRRVGLRAELNITPTSARVGAGDSIHLKVSVKNTGESTWLPTPETRESTWKKGLLRLSGKREHMGADRVPPRVGGVRLGIQLLDDAGRLLETDYFRYHLTPRDGRAIKPGEVVKFDVQVPMLNAGKYLLYCDLVSEFVCWFADAGSQVVRVQVEVT